MILLGGLFEQMIYDFIRWRHITIFTFIDLNKSETFTCLRDVRHNIYSTICVYMKKVWRNKKLQARNFKYIHFLVYIPYAHSRFMQFFYEYLKCLSTQQTATIFDRFIQFFLNVSRLDVEYSDSERFDRERWKWFYWHFTVPNNWRSGKM